MKLKKILEPKLPATYQVATSQDFIDGEIYQAEFIDKTLTNNQRTIFQVVLSKTQPLNLLTIRSVNLQIAFLKNVIFQFKLQ